MSADETDGRSWLPGTLGRRRRVALDETLFRRFEELEHGPLERLGELVHVVARELHDAQRLLAEQARDLRTLRQTVAALGSRIERLEAETREGMDIPPEPGHVLLLATPAGYRLVASEGPAPAPGELLVCEGVTYRVLRGGASPLPGDRRPCLLLLAA